MGAVLALLLAGALAGVLSLGESGGAATARSSRARLLGPTRPDSQVSFSLVLRLHQQRLQRFLTGLYDPQSPNYHHFLDARAFGSRFGLSAAQLSRLSLVLGREGIRITGHYPQETALDAVAPARVVNRIFGTRLMDYRSPTGRRYHSPLATPVVPRQISGMVASVAGLHGGIVPQPDDIPSSGVTPALASLAYDYARLHNQGINGQGEKVAVIELWQFSQQDLDNFSQQFHLPRFVPQRISIPRDGPATSTDSSGEGEAELDIEMIHAVAPQAQILDYNSPGFTPQGTDGLGDIIDKIVADGQTDIVSNSYGFCELSWARGDIQRDEQAIEAAVAHGISIFKSTGDNGAYQCQKFKTADHRLSVEWPASSPGVVAVGGTSLSVGANGGYAGEAAWEGALENSGGGGGLSRVYRRPSWQRAPGVLSRLSTGGREIPDVSANADPATGWTVVTEGSLGQVAGTSAAAPFWAGAMALIEQYAHQHGVQHLGFVDPMLYAIASTPQPAPPFHDITLGSNRYYPAGVGWDFATGLGSPDVYNLAQDIVRYLQSHPAAQ
jgi:subtilase family serine protease